MNKRQYFSLIEEYERLVEDRLFNPAFGDYKRLDELKETLLKHLNRMDLIAYHEKNNKYTLSSIEYLREIESIQKINRKIYISIEQLESIKEYNYHNSYIESRFFGLTINQTIVLFCIGFMTWGLMQIYKIIF